jgi:hypothetical protein
MDSTRAYWPTWMDSLRSHNLDKIAIWLLEAAGPLTLVTAQLLYLGQPLASPQTGTRLQALAQLLEQESEARAFAALLKGQQQ